MNPEKARELSPELKVALEPLLAAIESLGERIRESNQQIENIAKESYPQVARLEQVKGVRTLIALTSMLTLEDPHRFRKSRDVGCYVGLQPDRRNSGQSEAQLHISKEGDPVSANVAGAGCRTTFSVLLEGTAICDAGGIGISMSRLATPYDNARAESFMKTLKYEKVYRTEYRDLEESRALI